MSNVLHGFHVSFDMPDDLCNDERNALLDRFIIQAIEANGLQFGGGGSGSRWSGFVEPILTTSLVTDESRRAVIDWLRSESLVIHHTVSELIDLNSDEDCSPWF